MFIFRTTVNANYHHKHQNASNNNFKNGGGHHQRKLNFNHTNNISNNNSNNNNGYYHGNNNHHQKSQSCTSFFNNNNNNMNHSSSNNYNAPRNASMSPINKKYGRHTPPQQQYQQYQQYSTTPPNSSPFSTSNNGSNKKRRGPGGINSPLRLPAYYISPVGVSIGIPNTHFNYSKVYDSPSAKTLPSPPKHWTSMSPDELLANEPKFIVESDEQQPVATIIEKDNGKAAIYIGSSKRCLFDVDRIQIGKSGNGIKQPIKNIKQNDISGAARVSLGTAAAAAAAAVAISSNNNSDIFTNSLKLLLNIQA